MATISGVRVSSYMKNLAKSAGYISLDVFKSYAPTMSSLASTTKEASSSAYQAIKDFTSSSNDSDFSFKGIKDKSGQVLGNIWKNTIDDLRTGKIYNKERSDALGDEIASGFLGEDFNFDFDFDDDWGDDDESSSEDTGAKAQVAANVQSSKAIISAVDAMGRGLSASMTEATTQSASYIASSARENSLALFNLNKEGFGTITKALMSVNETIYGFSKIGEPLTAHMQNSSLFFTKTGESLNNIEQTLKQIEANTKPAPVAGSKGYKSKKSLADMMSDDEGINFSELMDSFKETVNEYKDLTSMFVDMLKPTAKSGGKNLSVLGMGATALAKKLVPTVFGDALKQLDESIKYGLGAGLTKVSKKRTGNMLVDTLLDMFAPSRDIKNSISASNYEKGAVQWDGVARKALTDVIPTTLLQIYSVLSGTDPMRFDYNSGKFVKASAISNQLKKNKERYVAEAGGDFYKEVQKAIKDSNSSDKDKMLVEAYKFFENAFDTGDHSIFKGSNIDPATYELIKSVATSMQKNPKTRRFNNKWSVESNRKAADFSNSLRSEEAMGYSIYQMEHNKGEFDQKGTGHTIIGLDQYGHNYYYYLQGLFRYAGYMVNNWGMVAGIVPNRNGRVESAPSLSDRDLPEIEKVIQLGSSNGERTTQEANIDLGLFSDDSEAAQEAKTVEGNTKKIKQWIKENVSDKLRKGVNKVFGSELTPEQFSVVGIMNSISTNIDTLMWGTEDNPEKGLFSYMFDKAKSMFEKMQEAFKEKVLDRFKNWFDKNVGDKGRDTEWFKDTRENLKGKWNTLKGRFKKVMTGHEEGLGYDVVDEAAYGKQITKPGLVAVSGGEMIIPSELNPFYHGATNKASQVNNERRISNRFLGMFAKGTAEASYFEELFGGTDELKGKKVQKRKITDTSILGMIGGAAAGAFAKLRNFINDEVDEKKIAKDKEKISNAIGNLLGEIGENKGEIGAGAVLGAGASILTGGIIGPIAGAALGAGIGFIRKSKTAQDFLFGEEDENGKRKRQKAYDFMMKEVPSIGTGAGLGAAAGLFMGSPILGAFLGAATGFVASNESFQNYLFGEKDENGKRSGGLLANKIFSNIDETFKNMGNRLKVDLHNLGKAVTQKVTDLFDFLKKKAKEPNSGFLGKLIGGTIGLGEKAIRLPINIANGITSGINDSISRGNLVKGYSTYSALEGRNMTASERMAARSKLNPVLKSRIDKDMAKFDEFLVSIEDSEKLEYYKKLIKAIKTQPTGSAAYNEAVEKLTSDPEYTKYMGSDSLGFLKKNAAKLSSLIGDESSRLNEEEDKKAKENKKVGLLQNIANNVTYLVTGKMPNGEDVEKKPETTTTMFGDTKTYDKNGDEEHTKENAEANAKVNGFLNNIKSIPSRISNGIGKLFGIGDEEGENKNSFLSKAKDWINDKIGVAKKFFTKIFLPIAAAVASIVAVVKGLFGSQDGLFGSTVNDVAAAVGLGGNPSENSEKGNGGPNDKGGTKTQFQTADGTIVTKDAKGNYVDANGNIVDGSSILRNRAGQDTFLDRFRKGTARQLITGKPTLAGGILNKGLSKLEKLPVIGEKLASKKETVTNIAKLAKEMDPTLFGQAASNSVDDALKNNMVLRKVTDALASVLQRVKDLPIPAKVKAKLPGCFDELATAISKNAGKIAENTSKLIQNISDIVPVLNVIVMITDFHTGYEDARTTLGITAEPTFPQRIISGLLRLVKNLIPIIGPFIPDDFVVNIFCKWIAPVFGLKGSELMKQREDAKAEVEAYNAEHGTNYDVGEYNKAVLNDYTLTERFGNVGKTIVQQTKDNISRTKQGFKKGGVKGALSAFVGADEVKNAYAEAGGGLKGVVEGYKTALENIGPGILGEFGSKSVDMFKFAFTGKLKEMLATANLTAFSKTNEGQADVNLLTQVISKAIFVPLETILTPIALVTSGVRNVVESVSAHSDTIKNIAGNIDNVIGLTNALNSIKEGDIGKLMSYSAADGDDNGFIGGLKIAAAIPVKFVAAVPTVLSAAGHALWNNIISPIVNKVKETTSNFKSGFTDGFYAAYTGEFGLTDVTEAKDDEGNPLSGFQKFILGTGRIAGGLFSLFAKAGEAIIGKAKEIFTKVKNTVATFGQTTGQIAINALTGDPAGMWQQEVIQNDPDNPVGGWMKGLMVAQKLLFTPISGITWVGRKVAETIGKTVEVTKTMFGIIGNRASDLNEYIKSGDPDGMMMDEFQDSEGNPASGIFKGIDYGLKFVMMPIAQVTKVGKAVGEKIEEIKAPIKASITKIAENQLMINNYMKAGDLSGLWSAETDFEDSPLSGVGKGLSIGLKLVNTLPTAVHWIGNGLKSAFSTFTDGIKGDIEKTKTYYDSLMKSANNGDVGAVMKLSLAPSSPFGGIFTFASSIIRIAAVFKAGTHWIGKKIKDAAADAKDALAGSWFGKLLGWDESDAPDTSTDTVASGGASGLAVNARNNSFNGFQSQLDPKYKNIPFAGTNIADAGCAPAVGTMIAASMGNKMSMNNAIDKARKYTNREGTSVKYFEDEFHASPLNSVSVVKNSLESGRPVILLGRDPSNTSKAKSPFGPDNHYVLATGMKNGKVLVNDPESSGPRVYDQSILNKSKYNLTYGGSSNRGRGMKKSKNSDVIWNILKGEGFSDAAAAGILGNAQQESTMSTTADGAAYGLFQFEKSTGSANNLATFAKKLGKSKDDPEVQTRYMLSLLKKEIKSYSGKTYTYPNGTVTWWPKKMTLDKYKKLTDPKEAAEIFERTYERPSIPMREKRKAYAADFYKLYSGTPYDSSKTSGSSDEADSASSTGDGNVLSMLSNIFGSLTNIFDIKNGFKLNSSSGGSDNNTDTSNGGGVINGEGAQAAASAAENELEYHESGNNITKFGKWSGCDGQPWCAAFAAWAIAQAFDGKKSSAVKALHGCSNVNYTPTLTDTFKSHNAWYKTPEVGDEVMYGDSGGPYHVGLVTSVNKKKKTYVSVEGNANDKVSKKVHSSFMDGNVIGYGRPDYSKATGKKKVNTKKKGKKVNVISADDNSYKATGSGLFGGSSGLLRKAAPSRFTYGSMKGQRFSFGGSSGLSAKNRFSGAGSNVTKTVTRTLNKLKKNLTGGLSNNGYIRGGIDPDLVEDLLMSITTLLNSINSNTAPVQQIYDVLSEYVNYVKTGKAPTVTNDRVSMPRNNNEVDNNFANLVTTLAAIARG